MKSHSWEILNDRIAIKNMNKSVFKHDGSGIPKDIRFFFGIEKMTKGTRRDITLEFEGNEYPAYIRMTKDRHHKGNTVSEQSLIFWYSEFRDVLQERFPNRFTAYREDKKVDDKTDLFMSFEKDRSRKDLYHIWFHHPSDEPMISVIPLAIDLEKPRLPKKHQVTTNRIIRDSKITRDLKTLYDNACQVCGSSIMLKNQKYSEAHHLRPLGGDHNGDDTYDNVLILCPIHHVEFDYCVIAIDPRTMKIIHRYQSNEWNGQPITFHSDHVLDPMNIEYHYQRFLE